MRFFLCTILTLPLTGYGIVETWNRTYNIDNCVEKPGMVLESADGNYVALAWGETPPMYHEILLLKVDGNGNSLWTRTYSISESDEACWFAETADEGFIIAGTTETYTQTDSRDILLIKTNASGDTLWTKTYGGQGDDNVSFVAQTPEGGYLAIGETKSLGPCEYGNIWVLKLDSLGDTLLTRFYGDTLYNSLHCANRGIDGYNLVGFIDAISTEYFSVVVLDAGGNEIRSYPFKIPESDYAPVLFRYFNAGHGTNVICGQVYNDNPECGPVLFMSDVTEYGYSWAADYGEDNGSYEHAYSIEPTSDTGYILATNRWTLLKTDEKGDSLWTRTFDGYADHAIQTSDGGFLVLGSKNNDLWLLKIDSNGDTLGVCGPLPVAPVTHQFEIANPVGQTVTLRYSGCRGGFEANVYDISGRQVDEIRSTSTSGFVEWGKSYGPGVYFIVPQGQQGNPGKVILIR